MSNTCKISGAQAVIQSLIEEEVPYIFGYPGGAIMPVYDALMECRDKIKHILTRHEQGAAHAAQGFARTSGSVGVCMATSGPGATNLITGIADAMIDSTPLVCITGQVASPLLGSDAFQETDVLGISMPVTKWNYLVTDPAKIPWAIARAFYIAKSGRPGPVLIDITKDAQFGMVEFKYEKCHSIRSYIPTPDIEIKQVDAAAKAIDEAQKPFVLFGQGVVLGHAEDELRQFIDKSGIPAGWTILGTSALPSDHPLNMGMLGMHGHYATNKLSNECDLMIAVGMRFDDRVTSDTTRYATQAKIIHLEIDPAEINKNIVVDYPVIGDVKTVLPMLTQRIQAAQYPEWVAQFQKLREIEEKSVIEKDLYPEKKGLTMGEVLRRVNEATNDDAVIVTDVGQHQMIASRYCKHKQPRSFVTSGGLGTMGFGLPAALGAKFGAPDRTVVLVVGDGGMQMTIQELGTIHQTQQAVKIFLLNNHYLGMVRQWQELFFDRRYSETYLENPDFVKIAEGYGIPGQKVDDRELLDEAVRKMIAHDGPYLLEVTIEQEDNVFPMVPAGASVSDVMLAPKKEND